MVGIFKRAMGLANLLKRVNIRQRQIRVTIFGLDGAGKTTLGQTMARDHSELPKSQGFQIIRGTIGDLNMAFWDVQGGAEDRTYWKNYLDGSDTIVFVVDSTARARIEEAKKEFNTITSLISERCHGCTILVVGTKSDQAGAMKVPEIMDSLDIETQGNKHGCLTCNARDQKSTDEVLRWICDDIIQRYFTE